MRVVLDTNTVVSALLFSGVASKLVPLWQSGRIGVLVSKPILEEYFRVLAYPKFRLTREDIKALIEEEVLPFVKPVRIGRRLSVVEQDPDDDKFLECAVSGRAKYLVTGDSELRALRSYRKVRILRVAEFLRETGLDVLR